MTKSQRGTVVRQTGLLLAALDDDGIEQLFTGSSDEDLAIMNTAARKLVVVHVMSGSPLNAAARAVLRGLSDARGPRN